MTLVAGNIKHYKPTTPGQRGRSIVVKPKGERHKPLVRVLKKHGGRNNTGRVTAWRQQGGHKRYYRIIDFKRYEFDGIPAKVEHIEYDPNRTCFIALICYANGARSYIPAPNELQVGDSIVSGSGEIKVGNSMELGQIPDGTLIHCIEQKPMKGAQFIRTAGGSAVVLGKDGGFVKVRLASKEVRIFPMNCRATIGELSNKKHNLVSLGKAGASRWKGRRPTVRGVAMNPIDHPHGGGEGRTSGGRSSVTPWGVPTKGKKTRKRNKPSNRFIVKRRKK
ncbi:MAG: 50S ribosomal protein L2 [Candidatus Comchoanobacterales bacterium]